MWLKEELSKMLQHPVMKCISSICFTGDASSESVTIVFKPHINTSTDLQRKKKVTTKVHKNLCSETEELEKK